MLKKRNLIIASLCGILLLMVVGYAAFNTLLNINGTTSITSNWDIKITSIVSKNATAGASNAEEPTYEDLTANFKVNLVSPGDSIEYDVTVTNQGTFNAALDKINISENDNPAIKFTTTGLEEGDILEKAASKKLTIKVEYDNNVTKQPDDLTANLTVTLNYVSEESRSIPATYNEGYYYCPDTYNANGSGENMTCSKPVTGQVLTSCSDSVCTSGAGTCGGLGLVKPTSITCPSSSTPFATVLDNGWPGMYCKTTSGGTTYNSVSCPGGYSSWMSAMITVGSTRVPVASCQRSCGIVYSCPNGYTKSGDGTSTKCTKNETADKLYHDPWYTCPDDYTLKEDNRCYPN